jgi:uncharacterized protein YecT (DUF1311 family)
VAELNEWVHIDAIQALVHHATAVITAIFLFGVTGRLIAYLIPDGHAKKIVMILDDVILLAVFALAGYRLVSYMWERPHLETAAENVRTGPSGVASDHDATKNLIAECRLVATAADFDLDQCLKQKNAEAQQRLEQSATRMTAEMRALDKVGSASVGAAHGFGMAQQAFMLYREAECRWRSTAVGSEAAEDTYEACMADLARRRTAQIQDLLQK